MLKIGWVDGWMDGWMDNDEEITTEIKTRDWNSPLHISLFIRNQFLRN